MEMNENRPAGPMEMCVRSEQLRAAVYGVAVGDALAARTNGHGREAWRGALDAVSR